MGPLMNNRCLDLGFIGGVSEIDWSLILKLSKENIGVDVIFVLIR
jgi:hypothetical protein